MYVLGLPIFLFLFSIICCKISGCSGRLLAKPPSHFSQSTPLLLLAPLFLPIQNIRQCPGISRNIHCSSQSKIAGNVQEYPNILDYFGPQEFHRQAGLARLPYNRLWGLLGLFNTGLFSQPLKSVLVVFQNSTKLF